MVASTYVHSLSPFAIQFPASWQLGALHLEGIRWYGLAYLTGFVLGYLIILHMARRGTTPMKPLEVADFITLVAVGTMAGGRLGYCLFYSPSLFTDFSASFPFWGVLKVYEGGMASHGGIMGVMVVCLWWARKHRLDPFHTIDLVTLGSSLGFFFGRLANFINGELWGREAPAALKWAVKFPSEMYGWTRENLTRLKEIGPAVQALGQVKGTHGEVIPLTSDSWRGWVDTYRTDAQSWSTVNEVIEQLVRATQSGQTQIIEALAPFLTPRYPSQLIQALLEGLLVFIILSLIWTKPRKPGVVSAWFGILYATARIIGEQFRMPDAHIGFQWLGLTRGQWLSIGMLLFAFAYLAYILSRPSKPLGGWGINQHSTGEERRSRPKEN